MDHKNLVQSSVSATGLLPFLQISVCSGSSLVNWSQNKFQHTQNTFPHTDRKFGSKFCSIPAIQIKGTCYYSQLFHILSNKQGKWLTSHFASCSVTLSLRQNFYRFAVALNLAKRISKGKVN